MKKKAILATIASDSHSWNLVYLELLLKEYGYDVFNLGVCTNSDDILKQCYVCKPEIVLISTINGHAHIEALDISKKISTIKKQLKFKLVIGGKINTKPKLNSKHICYLINNGYDAVFVGENSIEDFLNFISTSERAEHRERSMSYEKL